MNGSDHPRRVSSSMSEPADTAYAPLHRTTELSALSLVATYTTRDDVPGTTHSSPSPPPPPSAADPLLLFPPPPPAPAAPAAWRAFLMTFSTELSPFSSSMDARSIHESASLFTENTTHTPALVFSASSECRPLTPTVYIIEPAAPPSTRAVYFLYMSSIFKFQSRTTNDRDRSSSTPRRV